LRRSNINVVGFLLTSLAGHRTCLAVEDVFHYLVPSLDLVGGSAGHEVEQLSVDVESQLSVLAGLAVDLLRLLAPRLSILEVVQGVADAEVVLVLHLAHVDLLQLVEQLEVIVYLGIGAGPDVFFRLEQYLKGASLLLALATGSGPLLDYLLGLTDWRLHEEGGVMGG
jgi:hypothetical protein